MDRNLLNKKKRSGCLRTVLILIILLVSLSTAFLYLNYSRGLYQGDEPEYATLAITHATVFKQKGEILTDATIVIEGNEITCVGADCAVPEQARVIDAKGRAAIPGLINMQVRFYQQSQELKAKGKMALLLSFTQQHPALRQNFHLAGITTIRSVGDVPENILALRRQVESGDLAGPKIFCTGPEFTAPDGHPAGSVFANQTGLAEAFCRLVDNPADARREVDALALSKVNGMKVIFNDYQGVYPRLDKSVLEAIVGESIQNGTRVAAETGSNEELIIAADNGVFILDHTSVEPLDSAALLALQVQPILYLPRLISFEQDSAKAGLAAQNLKRVYEAGIQIGVGSGTDPDRNYRRSLHREMELMVEAGIPPAEVLEAATRTAAVFLQVDHELGTIETGKLADLVLVKGKPWTAIGDLQQISTVIQEGEIVVDNGRLVHD